MVYGIKIIGENCELCMMNCILKLTQLQHLRQSLDAAGLNAVGIVAADGAWAIAANMLKDKDLLDAISVVGAHYPGTTSSANAIKTGKKLWASEDYSTFNDNIGKLIMFLIY